MRALTLITFLFAVAPFAFGGRSTHTTHIVTSDDDTEIRVVRESGGEQWASFRKNGIRYVTTDAGVLAEIEKVMAKHRELSHEHSRLGRQHSALGREHSALGRQHSRLGRAGESKDLERRQRELEASQRKLEERQRQLEDHQRELEAKQRLAERDAHRAIEQIFDRAVRSGKAKRD